MTLVPSLALALLGAAAPRPALPAAQDPELTQDYWSEVARTLAERRGVAAALPVDAEAAALRAGLVATEVAGLSIQGEESLTEVMGVLQAMTGLPIVVDERAENAALDEGILFEVNLTNPIRADRFLDLITDFAGDDVGWTVRNGVILVTSADRAREACEVFLHPIADLLGAFEADEAAMTVAENVLPETWDLEGIAIEPTGAFLLVVHTREAQLAVEAFLSDLRAFQASLAGPPTFNPVPAEHEYAARLARLDGVSFSAQFADVPLTEVAAYLQDLTGVNFVVDLRVRDELDEEQLLVSLDLHEANVRNVLDMIVETRDDLRWTVDGDLVRFTTLDEERTDAVFALYDVRDIVSPADPERAGGFAVGGDELEALVLATPMLEDLIRNQIDPDSWDWCPAYSLRISATGIMAVSQAPAVQARIRGLLTYLQEIAQIQLEVQERYERGR